MSNHKIGVLILLDILHLQGAENIAVNIAINLKKFENYLPIVCSTRRGGVLEKKLNDHNVHYINLGRNNFFEFYKFSPLIKLIKEYNIKLIHTHKIGSNFWGGVIGKLFGIPVISHFHAHHKMLEKSSDLIASKIINKLSAKIISISEFERQRLIDEEGISPTKIVTIYNGIKYEDYVIKPRIEIKEQLGINTNTPVVAIVAAFRKQKNHEMFLLAAREILKRNRDVIFLLVGEGIERKEVERKAVNLGINNNSIFTGLRQDISNILSIIDIGVLSSYWEGLPLAVLEYMAASKPVVSTDVGGVCELVEDKENGFLVPQGDYKMLAQKISLLIENKELAQEMGLKGYIKIKENFSEDVMMQKIQNTYKGVLSL